MAILMVMGQSSSDQANAGERAELGAEETDGFRAVSSYRVRFELLAGVWSHKAGQAWTPTIGRAICDLETVIWHKVRGKAARRSRHLSNVAELARVWFFAYQATKA